MTFDEQEQAENRSHKRDLRDLTDLICELPQHRQSYAADVFGRILRYEEKQEEKAAIYLVWAGEMIRRLKQRLNTCQAILVNILRACSGHNEIREKIVPYVLTLKRFNDEQKAPDFTLEDASRDAKRRMASIRERGRAHQV